jgi:hypothetical protein
MIDKNLANIVERIGFFGVVCVASEYALDVGDDYAYRILSNCAHGIAKTDRVTWSIIPAEADVTVIYNLLKSIGIVNTLNRLGGIANHYGYDDLCNILMAARNAAAGI